MAQRTLRALSRPLLLNTQDIHISAGIGLTVLPVDTGDLDRLLQNADMAMCHAEERGGNDYQFFSAEIDARNRSGQLSIKLLTVHNGGIEAGCRGLANVVGNKHLPHV